MNNKPTHSHIHKYVNSNDEANNNKPGGIFVSLSKNFKVKRGSDTFEQPHTTKRECFDK